MIDPIYNWWPLILKQKRSRVISLSVYAPKGAIFYCFFARTSNIIGRFISSGIWSRHCSGGIASSTASITKPIFSSPWQCGDLWTQLEHASYCARSHCCDQAQQCGAGSNTGIRQSRGSKSKRQTTSANKGVGEVVGKGDTQEKSIIRWLVSWRRSCLTLSRERAII